MSESDMTTEEMTEAMSLEEPEVPKSVGTTAQNYIAENMEESNAEVASPQNLVPSKSYVDACTAESRAVNVDTLTKFSEKGPLDLVPYIEKYTKVQLEKNYSYVGFVHSIDPISHTIILSVPKEGGTFQTVIIPGAVVLDITQVAHNSSIIPPDRKPVQKINFDDEEIRKKQLLSWLKDNHLPVTEEGANLVFGGVTLMPPYEEKDVCTTNPIIALEIRKIIDRMPADYQPK